MKTRVQSLPKTQNVRNIHKIMDNIQNNYSVMT